LVPWPSRITLNDPTTIAEELCRHFRRFQHLAHTGEANPKLIDNALPRYAQPRLGQRLVGAHIEISLTSDEKTLLGLGCELSSPSI
jgi:hypothetical protein